MALSCQLSLDGCGFFISIVIRFPFNSISDGSEWWLFYILVVILMWLCKEVSHLCLCHYLDQKISKPPPPIFYWNHPNKPAVAAMGVYHIELLSLESLPLGVQVDESLKLQNLRIHPSFKPRPAPALADPGQWLHTTRVLGPYSFYLGWTSNG